MRLYHYTAPQHLLTIWDAGFLKTVESNVSHKREHAGPDVVWLTTNPNLYDPTAESTLAIGHSGLYPEKTRVRFEVELPKRQVHKWREWAPRKGSPEQAMQMLARAGGSSQWRVIERPILAAEWVGITLDGQPLEDLLAERAGVEVEQ